MYAKTFAALRRSMELASIAALAAGIFSAHAASATALVTGNNALAGTTAAAEPQLAGTVVEDELTAVSFAIGAGTFSTNLQSRVVLSVDGTYDFYWRLTDTSYTGTDGGGLLKAFRLINFGVPIAGLNGDYRTDGVGDVAPNRALVFTGAEDQAVNFIFDGGLSAPGESFFMFLDTDAHSYSRTAQFDLAAADQISGTFATFGVGGAVPEPATWALMIGGMGMAGAALRRRRTLATA